MKVEVAYKAMMTVEYGIVRGGRKLLLDSYVAVRESGTGRPTMETWDIVHALKARSSQILAQNDDGLARGSAREFIAFRGRQRII